MRLKRCILGIVLLFVMVIAVTFWIKKGSAELSVQIDKVMWENIEEMQ